MCMTIRTTIQRILGICAVALAALTVALLLPTGASAQTESPTRIVNLQSNRCLDMRLQDGTYGAPAQLYTCHGRPNQRFTLQYAGQTPATGPYYKIISSSAGLCLEVQDASRYDGARIDQGGCSADAHKFWYRGPSNLNTLVNLNSGKCLAVVGNSTAERARIEQRECGTTASDSWLVPR